MFDSVKQLSVEHATHHVKQDDKMKMASNNHDGHLCIVNAKRNHLIKQGRVLDAFANRIGNRTWQTVITNEGLLAVKKLLRKTASKNTAVSCHWIT